MNINLELYKTFYYVAKNKSITRAANELCISQPAISKSIKTLEEQIGSVLFVRQRDGVQLTEVGELIYKKVKNAMELIESAENDLNSAYNLEHEYINIATSKTIIQEYLMPYIREFYNKYPNIKIRIFTDKTNVVIPKANLGLIDVIITNLPANVPDNFNEVKLTELHDSFVASEKFSYLKGKKITLDEFKELPLITLTKDTINRTRLDDFCVSNNIQITPEMEFGSNSLIKEFALGGFGIGMLTKEHVKKELDDGSLFELDVDISLEDKYLGALYTKENNRPITKKFLDFLLDNNFEI